MAFDKFLGKERRRQYRGSRRFDRSCRNHGSCPYCTGNRTYQTNKEKTRINSLEMEDFSSEQPDQSESESESESQWAEMCDELRSQLKLRGWEGVEMRLTDILLATFKGS